jgi:hypothetical protein
MAITNNNRPMIDRPMWEQCTSAPAASAAGVAMVDDGSRFIYHLFSVTSFWAYDTWGDTWQQLASPPGGTLAVGSCLRYVREMGAQINGEVFGSVYALIASGSAVVFYRYNIADNTWSSALSVVNLPAAWGTDGRLICPEPMLNGYVGGYHNALALNTITASASATATVGATTISVNALPLALPIGAVLNFGTSAAPVWAVLTAPASAAATSITVTALVSQVTSAAVAYWYADMFLWGNNATTGYRYNIAGNAWTTTSANSGTPALAAVPAAPGAGMVSCWLPGSTDANALDRIILVRGAASSTIYEYSLTGNTWTTITYYPSTDTFGIGTSSGIRKNVVSGKSAKLLIQKDNSGRIFEFDRKRPRMEPKLTQNLISNGAAVVGDKMSVVYSPDNIEFVYTLLNTSSYFMRSGLFF